MDINIIIGNGIKFYRNKKQLTQEDLAKNLGVIRTSLVQYESGKTSIPFDKLIQLCDILEIKIDNIISDKILNHYKQIESIYE